MGYPEETAKLPLALLMKLTLCFSSLPWVGYLGTVIFMCYLRGALPISMLIQLTSPVYCMTAIVTLSSIATAVLTIGLVKDSQDLLKSFAGSMTLIFIFQCTLVPLLRSDDRLYQVEFLLVSARVNGVTVFEMLLLIVSAMELPVYVLTLWLLYHRSPDTPALPASKSEVKPQFTYSTDLKLQSPISCPLIYTEKP